MIYVMARARKVFKSFESVLQAEMHYQFSLNDYNLKYLESRGFTYIKDHEYLIANDFIAKSASDLNNWGKQKFEWLKIRDINDLGELKRLHIEQFNKDHPNKMTGSATVDYEPMPLNLGSIFD